MSRLYMAPVTLLLAAIGCVPGKIVDNTIIDGMTIDNHPVPPAKKSITDFAKQLVCEAKAPTNHGTVGNNMQGIEVAQSKDNIVFSSIKCADMASGMAWVSLSCKFEKEFFMSQDGFNNGFPYQVHIAEAITFDSTQESNRWSEAVGVVSMTIPGRLTAELRHSVARSSLLKTAPMRESIDSNYVWSPKREELESDVHLDFQVRRACYGASEPMEWKITSLDFTTIPQ